MEGKIGIVHISGRYKRVSEPRLLQFEYLIVTVLKMFWGFEKKRPNGLRFWFDFRKGKMHWIWLNKITTCEFGPVSAWVEMAIACPYDISYPRTTARSNGTRWPWWNPNRCYPLEDNCLRFQSSAYGRFLLEEDHIILLSVELTCRCNCSWRMCVFAWVLGLCGLGWLRGLSQCYV